MTDSTIEKNARKVRGFYTQQRGAFDVEAYLAGAAAYPTLLVRLLPEVFSGPELVTEKPARPIVLLNLGYWSVPHMQLQDAQVALVHEVARRAPNLRGARVLDLGSGFSGPAIILAQEYNAEVDCVNIVEQQVEVARALVARNGVGGRVRCHVANAMALPFPDGSFDVVFCLEAAHNFVDKPRFLAEAERLLRPGGTLLLADLTTTSLGYFTQRLPVLGVTLIRARDWRDLIVRSGLRITGFDSIGQHVWPVQQARNEPTPWRAGLHRGVALALNGARTWPRRLERLAGFARAVVQVCIYLTLWRLWALLGQRGVRGYVIFVARKPVRRRSSDVASSRG